MKKFTKFLIILFAVSFFNYNSIYAAGTSSSGGDNYTSLYKQGKKLVLRAKRLDKKNEDEKAKKLYFKALKNFEKAYAKDKKNPDILNYLGYTLRKTGDLEKAEIFYLKGLKLDANHLGINEYLGELYVQTGRIRLAKERLQLLKGCECEEYDELKELIEKN